MSPRNGNVHQTRRRSRQRQKQRHRQETAKTSAQRQKPQASRSLPVAQRSRKRSEAGNLSRLAATKPTPSAGAGLKPAHMGSTKVRNINQRAVSSPSKTRTLVTSKRKRLSSTSPLLYGARLLLLGVGISAIAGTILSAWDPTSRLESKASVTATTPVEQSQVEEKHAASLPIAQEIPSLKAQVQALATKNSQLQAGVFFIDLDTGAYMDWEATSTFSAASTIKLPVLVAFFQDVDAGKIRLDEQLTLQPSVIGGGSGDMQYKKPGTQFTALETATKMITISDNTATNMIVNRLGGVEALNQRFRSWGLTATAINNPLPDLEGTNTTTPKELAAVMGMVNQGNLVSQRSRDRILDIMQRTVTNTLLPPGLGKGATIAHKTGDIGSLVGDVGLIDMPMGKRYIAAVMVKRPHNDANAKELIRQISRVGYQYFSQSAASRSFTASPSPTSAPFIAPATGSNPVHTSD
ncbi:MAG: class A beta-lactamase-related serine hydrolase [Aphanothece sp. CMT-3BRIN-NPC111]|nr:class A beta-lactamase-related serine hydrolase [Aphanothece sp. CMT-3BRIN-NPC111]